MERRKTKAAMMPRGKIFFKSFTLLELVIALSILLVCFSFLGVRINVAIARHKFLVDARKIEGYFDYCKKMALSTQSDLFFTLKKEGKNLQYEVSYDEAAASITRLFAAKGRMKDISFTFREQEIDELKILFSSNGGVHPKGEILLTSSLPSCSKESKKIYF